MSSIFDVPVGNKLTPQQLREAAGAERPPQEVVLAESKSTDDENPVTEAVPTEVVDTNRNYFYPLRGTFNAPAKIVFTAHKIDGFFDLTDHIDEPIREKKKREAQEKLDKIEEDAKAKAEQKEEEQVGVLKSFLKSYENTNADNPVGSVTLPLFRGLSYNDGVTFNSVDVGLLGAAGDIGAADNNGRLTGAAKGLSSQVAAKAVGALTGPAVAGGVSKLFGGGAVGGALVGAVAGGDLSASAGAVAKSATRVSTAPNERMLFERVNLRTFQFTFKMIAKSPEEQREIKNIVKFFRQEVYPEAIRITEGGAPFAYEFPNVFSIDVKNRNGSNPGFDIQRCYLESVGTQFNATATGLYDGTEFIEVDVTLNFKEISALDKSKVRKGF